MSRPIRRRPLERDPGRDAEALRLWDEGLTLRFIGKRLGVSFQRVHQILRRQGAARRSVEPVEGKWLELLTQGPQPACRMREAARQESLPLTTLYKRAHRLGVTMRHCVWLLGATTTEGEENANQDERGADP